MIPAMAGSGGAERTMSYLLEYLAGRHEVALLTLESPDAVSFFSLPSSVKLIHLNKLGGRGFKRLGRIVSRIWSIRQAVRTCAPDVVLSFMDTMNVAALVGCFHLDVPVVVSERNDPALHRIGRAKELLRDRVYHLAHTVVAQTERVAHYFMPRLQGKLCIIPNSVPRFTKCARPDQPDAEGRLRIVAVGRLEPHKRLDHLIRAFARIAQEHPNWDLHIIGEGRQRGQLENLVRLHRLGGRVKMPGVINDVARYLCACHLMAFPSRYEGFPNALAEGLALGLPAIGLRGVSGVEELIVDGKTGLLIDEGEEALAAALLALMRSGAVRLKAGNAARRHVRQWEPDRIFKMWDIVLKEAIDR